MSKLLLKPVLGFHPFFLFPKFSNPCIPIAILVLFFSKAHLQTCWVKTGRSGLTSNWLIADCYQFVNWRTCTFSIFNTRLSGVYLKHDNLQIGHFALHFFFFPRHCGISGEWPCNILACIQQAAVDFPKWIRAPRCLYFYFFFSSGRIFPANTKCSRCNVTGMFYQCYNIATIWQQYCENVFCLLRSDDQWKAWSSVQLSWVASF